MDYVAFNRPSLNKLAIAFRCGNGYMSIANALVRSGSRDKKTIRFIRKKLIDNLSVIMISDLKVKKKLQIIVFLLSFKAYTIIMRKKLKLK